MAASPPAPAPCACGALCWSRPCADPVTHMTAVGKVRRRPSLSGCMCCMTAHGSTSTLKVHTQMPLACLARKWQAAFYVGIDPYGRHVLDCVTDLFLPGRLMVGLEWTACQGHRKPGPFGHKA